MPCHKTVTRSKAKPVEWRGSGMMKAFKILFFFLSVVSLGLGGCDNQGKTSPKVRLELVAEGFTSPVALIDPGDGSQRLFVVDQTGLIWVIADGKRIDKPLLDIREKVVQLNSFYDERGLLGLVFHPDFAANGHFYVSYSGHLQDGTS